MHDERVDSDAPDAPASRRSLLRRAAIGTAAAGALSLATPARPALAADPNDLDLTKVNDHTARSGARYVGARTATGFNVESGASDANNDTILDTVLASGGTAMLGVANSASQHQVGIVGWSRKPNGTGVVGFTGPTGAYGGDFFGGLAEVRLRPGGAAPITLTNAHQVGELYEDETGVLWICVAAGSPGAWRELAGPASAGAFHPIAPQRVYDSRPDRTLAVDQDRVISVATSTAGVADVVPVGATAIAATVTVTDTERGGGFVSIRPQGSTDNGTSSINWWGPGQSLATTVITGLGANREIVAKAGANVTHLIVDVTGYYR
jgi:hypothetical protein